MDDQNGCQSLFQNRTAEQWANYAEKIEHDLGIYKYMAKV